VYLAFVLYEQLILIHVHNGMVTVLYSWLRSTVVECRSLDGELTLSCTRPKQRKRVVSKVVSLFFLAHVYLVSYVGLWPENFPYRPAADG